YGAKFNYYQLFTLSALVSKFQNPPIAAIPATSVGDINPSLFDVYALPIDIPDDGVGSYIVSG
ncbi:MAG: hypothetical protein EZS28_055543, partial [Streblomastix strix]